MAVPVTREGVLNGIGRQLVHEDKAAAPAYLALLSGTGAETRLEVADLARSSPSADVLLFDSSSTTLAAEFRRRGVAMPTEAERDRTLLERLGVQAQRIRLLRVSNGGTNGEVAALAAEHRDAPGAVIVSWHHSARLHRIIRRRFRDPLRRPAVVVPRYAREWEDGWWTRRDLLRVGLVELQKLFLDLAAHPLS